MVDAARGIWANVPTFCEEAIDKLLKLNLISVCMHIMAIIYCKL